MNLRYILFQRICAKSTFALVALQLFCGQPTAFAGIANTAFVSADDFSPISTTICTSDSAEATLSLLNQAVVDANNSDTQSTSYCADLTCQTGPDGTLSIVNQGYARGSNVDLVGSEHAGANQCTHIHVSDFSDAPASYNSAYHVVNPDITLGLLADVDAGGRHSDNSDGDDNDGINDDDGVVIVVKDLTIGNIQLEATVTGTVVGATAMLCGYLDGAADGSVNGNFDRAIDYTGIGVVGQGSPTIVGTNEELCIQVTDSNSVTLSGGGSNDANASCTVSGDNFTCVLVWNPKFTAATTTFARFRLTTDPVFFSTSSPSPFGAALDGEVEDMQEDITPTLVSMGDIDLLVMTPDEILSTWQVDSMNDPQLLQFLSRWGIADQLTADWRARLIDYLDPNGDAQVAVLAWDTLMEEGTIGFRVYRQENINWAPLNAELLQASLNPLGAEYYLIDRFATSGNSYHYRIEELENDGNTREYGPFSLTLP